MPFISLPGAVRMHYEMLSDPSTSPTSTLLDSRKPTLVVLVPFYTSQASELPQLNTSLRQSHNILALSPRSHGRTAGEVKPAQDAFVSAADLAFAFEALQLPPSQIYAPGSICARISLAFAAMFPDLVTSLVLCAAASRDAMTSKAGFYTLEASMFDPEEVEDLHETFAELSSQLWGGYCSSDRTDEFINLLLRRHNPRHALRSYDLCRMLYLSINLTSEMLAQIKTPVLLLHGANDAYSHPSCANEWKHLLTGSTEVEVQIVPDAPHIIFYTHPEVVASHMVPFLSRHATLGLLHVSPDFSHALRVCAAASDNPKTLLRNPRDPVSFSALSEEEKAEAVEDLARIRRYEVKWSSKPLIPGAEGLEPWEESSSGRVARPKWRWSRRHDCAPPSDRAASARFSVASEIIVVVASIEQSVKNNSNILPIPCTTVESKGLPSVPDGEDEDDELDSDSDGDGTRGRKDSGFVDALESHDGLEGKQVGVVESMSMLALNHGGQTQAV